MNKATIFILFSMLTLCNACNDDAFLDRKPTDILLPEQVWSDRTLVTSVIADLYDRINTYQNLHESERLGDFNEAFLSRNGFYNRYTNSDWGFGEWGIDWFNRYEYIRHLNSFIDNIQKAEAVTRLTEEDKAGFLAEARFLRAFAYFDMVKRIGGVPIITETLRYDFSGDPSYLKKPRSKEHEVYDFVISELEEVKDILADKPTEKSRATKGAALALQSRVALYAASIAKYSEGRPGLALSNGEIGIPASMAKDYYAKALSSAQAITGYDLYLVDNEDLSANFANLFLDKNGNSEMIFIKDYKLKHKTHPFTVESQPFSLSEESFGGRINPSLNLVVEFEKLDNTFAPLEVGTDAFYTDPLDLFVGRDARLLGTVLAPGATFRGSGLDIWAGFMLADKSIVTSDDFKTLKKLPGKNIEQQVVGKDGPIPGKEYTAQTGFLIRKFLDPAKGAGSLGTHSDVPWIYLRYAEVLLNAAEAAFELGNPDLAAEYMNKVRSRAGFTIPLGGADITFDRIVHERRVELAFEDHILWDAKRWRIADKVWDGSTMSEGDLMNNLGKADKPWTQVFGLMPYVYHAPGDPNDGKWVFTVSKPAPVTGADRFRVANYYSEIAPGVIANNDLIVQNPK